ncbi:MAG: hypothetical protein K5644_03510 [Lachnospiraceae bacterium]|nr:hypothetical protein [Lachnospiraceae bacterium]
MIISSTATGVIVPENPNAGLRDLKKAGFENVYMDFGLICPAGAMRTLGNPNFKSNFRTRAIEDPARLEECVAPLFEKAKDNSLEVTLAKAPTLLLDTRRTDLNELVMALAKESIKSCGIHGVKKLIVDSLFAGVSDNDKWKVNKDFYLSLVTLARENNVRILLENQCRDVGGHLLRGMFSDGAQTIEFINELNKMAGADVFGLAYNVGNANLSSMNHYEYLTSIGSYVEAVLISDNDGMNEASLLPYTSTGQKGLNVEWLSLVRGIRASGFDGDIVLEYADTARDTSAMLKLPMLTYAKEVADFLKWQFEIEKEVKAAGDRVLFGAGNMCRNYIKNYGKEYPALFTCDNNSANWSKTFEGLEIKNPEELKSLPEDVTVFICNMYYTEIEEQLRDMGLKNPIKYFSDEYMPSFHFERLDMAVVK